MVSLFDDEVDTQINKKMIVNFNKDNVLDFSGRYDPSKEKLPQKLFGALSIKLLKRINVDWMVTEFASVYLIEFGESTLINYVFIARKIGNISILGDKEAMTCPRQTDIFKPNFFFWKVFGIWEGESRSKFYIYYSFTYLFFTLFIYNILLTLNLICTPLNIELLIREVIFYFTEIAVTAKVLMILLMRHKIRDVINLIDCKEFEGNDEGSKIIIEQNNASYKIYWKLYAVVSNLAYTSQVFGPLLVNLIWETNIALPVCKYYFLSEDLRQRYFIYLFAYQSFGIFGHMMYNVNIDTFIAGLLLMAIIQVKIIQHKLNNFKLKLEDSTLKKEVRDDIQILKLNNCLRHYDLVLKYCSIIQDILSVTMFVQFGMASVIICTIMCGFVMPSSTETTVFMVTYFFAMTMQIFVPAWLGTQLSYESKELVFAAYRTEWIPMTNQFKKSILIFVERAKIPIQLTGLKMFPLTLATFTSIMKTAYSFFTLIRNVQDRQDSLN